MAGETANGEKLQMRLPQRYAPKRKQGRTRFGKLAQGEFRERALALSVKIEIEPVRLLDLKHDALHRVELFFRYIEQKATFR